MKIDAKEIANTYKSLALSNAHYDAERKLFLAESISPSTAAAALASRLKDKKSIEKILSYHNSLAAKEKNAFAAYREIGMAYLADYNIRKAAFSFESSFENAVKSNNYEGIRLVSFLVSNANDIAKCLENAAVAYSPITIIEDDLKTLLGHLMIK